MKLTLTEIQNISRSRSNRWHGGDMNSWSALEWAGAMAGEAGEACNAAKKLKRLEDQIKSINEGNRHYDATDSDIAKLKAQVAWEVADTVLYGVLVAQRVGLELAPFLIAAFNKKSEEYQFPERLGPDGPYLIDRPASI